jgi:hypothetical protein
MDTVIVSLSSAETGKLNISNRTEQAAAILNIRLLSFMSITSKKSALSPNGQGS